MKLISRIPNRASEFTWAKADPARRAAKKLAGGEARHERNHRNPASKNAYAPAGRENFSRHLRGASIWGRSPVVRSCLASPPANLFQPSGLELMPQFQKNLRICSVATRENGDDSMVAHRG
jgi:hypothetical protein